jgi:integrase
MSTTRYQNGTIDRVSRAKGADVWVYRWRETGPDRQRIQRKKVIGTVIQYKTKAAATKATENLRSEINSSTERIRKMTVGDAWGHYQDHELRDPLANRSPTTIAVYLGFFQSLILPDWRDTPIDAVKPKAVEKWLSKLERKDKPLAPATKAKVRNLLSALYSHLKRHELWIGDNPIASVRQPAQRQREPDVLSVDEVRDLINNITGPAARVMVLVAAASGLRRSEWRGLKWSDLDFDRLVFHLKRGLVRNDETRLKTAASRKPLPMHPELAQVLKQWRTETPYPEDEAWVFASPATGGKMPYWPDAILKDHVRPALRSARIDKTVGWHTFRHSLGTTLSDSGENIKVIQELLRHANSRITLDLYTQATTPAKVTALGHLSGLFVVPASKKTA